MNYWAATNRRSRFHQFMLEGTGDPAHRDDVLDRLASANIPESRWAEVRQLYKECERNLGYHDSDVGSRHELRLETIAKIPWDRSSSGVLPELAAIRRQLDEEHHGSADMKREILEYCAIARHARARRGVAGTLPALLLHGDPGVGKTSLARTIARILGRRFTSVSFAASIDVEALKGYNIAYRGSRPGLLTEALIRASERDAVFLIDEVDKVTARAANVVPGQAAEVLLPLLDPEQNQHFRDEFLELDLDYSSILFVLTANDLERIGAAILDRVRTITLPAYSNPEKIGIARRHLLPRLIAEYGLDGEVTVTDEALAVLVEEYSREPGVRQLRQRLQRLLAAGTLAIELGITRHIAIDAVFARATLGPPGHPRAIGFRSSSWGAEISP